ncbi:type II secretion system F family protein [Pyrofollis japonicus]|uniref:type II secretion system F family protein n=1 Tax=Pyrofollis japonicus TaxID=3060460 RepID=UPI00295B8064|nr:type II secretion system F family protein [Pyrofollis japonicus]BEP17677.1 type II secretion system F family protein [Pyrofollis japonicus]
MSDSKAVGEIKSTTSLLLIFDSVALLLFRKQAEAIVKRFRLSEEIEKAGLTVFPTLYVARLLFAILILSIVLGITDIIVLLVAESLIAKVIMLLVSFLVPLILFSVGLAYPSIKASSRADAVDKEFPFFAAYMTAMAYAGVAPEKVIERLANLKVFKALRKEALRILRDVKIFGKDILTALEKNAATHPSRLYRDFMLGYLTTIRTGGDVRHYLEIRTQEVFAARMEDLRNRAEKVGLVVEAYAAVAILGTLSFYIFFIVSGLVGGGGGFAGINGIMLYTFVALPAITAAIISMLDSLIPGQEGIREPYAYLLVSGVAGFLVTGIMFSLTGALSDVLTNKITRSTIIWLTSSLAAGLFTTSIIPGIVFVRRVRRERAVLRAVSSFFRDLSEIRRTGLSPEKSLIVLAKRNYGELNNIVKRIAGAVSIGLHIERAARRALRGYTSWILRVSMRFLVDAIDVGGGSATTIDAIARFIASLIDIHESLRKRLRPYIVMPYFGAILVAVSSVLTLLMLSQAVSNVVIGGAAYQARISPETINMLLLIASLGSIVNAWLSGLVAGKIQDQSLASGFFHASLLTVLTLLSLLAVINMAPSFAPSAPPG